MCGALSNWLTLPEYPQLFLGLMSFNLVWWSGVSPQWVEVCDGEDWGEWWAHYCNYGGPSLAGRAGHYHNNCGSHVKVSGQQRNSHYHPPSTPPSPSLLVAGANSLTLFSNYDLLLRRNFLILYQISEYFSYRVRGSENIVELLPVEIKVTFLM